MNRRSWAVCHLTSAHPRHDVRIFIKECKALAANHYDVNLVVADGMGDEVRDNVNIFSVAAPRSRLGRMLLTTRRVYRKALEIDADIYHLHDPELLPVALKLKRQRKIVFFDAHEDFPKQLLKKPYLPRPLASFLAFYFSWYERYIGRRLDAVVSATPSIDEKFKSFARRSININNYPLLDEFDSPARVHNSQPTHIAYVGGISEMRGIVNLVSSLKYLSGVRLYLIGEFSDQRTYEYCRSLEGWEKVDFLGYQERSKVASLLEKSFAGVVTFLEHPNHISAQPNKMFEYMSASLPIVTSNFPLWKAVVEGNSCGFCVDPDNPKDIAAAIQSLKNNTTLRLSMGRNARQAVLEHYNWETQSQRLVEFYDSSIHETHKSSL
tara:strand:- start:2591 stop:3730 length:1140 start_codon:yes stop_codon:yes gene_type:complete